MNTPHTSEPWHINPVGGLQIACVNGMAGITNPAAVPAMVEALKTCAGYFAALDRMQPEKDHGEVGTLVRAVTTAALANLESPTVGASDEPVIDWHSRFDGVREALGRVTKERDALKAALTRLGSAVETHMQSLSTAGLIELANAEEAARTALNSCKP